MSETKDEMFSRLVKKMLELSLSKEAMDGHFTILKYIAEHEDV